VASNSAAPRRRGGIVWFTGMSGSGKTTLAAALRESLHSVARVEILDGDVVRRQLSPQLGFSRDDRVANVRRIGRMALELAGEGAVAVAAAISPHREVRDEVRQMATTGGIPFVEIYLNPPLQTLIEKDVKGLYQRALAGEIANFTGISDPYEAPLHPELELVTHAEPVEVSTARIVELLRDRRIVSSA
jgi:adenylylsulfate kinase